MDLYQLKTFVTVAREGSITRASERLHLSQPAVSAHIKALEEALELTLFERTARGMSLTDDGRRLIVRAERALASHQELIEEASRIKGRLTGTLRVGAGSNADHAAVGRLLVTLAARCPDVEVALKHGSSQEIVNGLLQGSLDAGFYHEAGESDPSLKTVEVSRFTLWVAAPPDLVSAAEPLDWSALAAHPWIYPAASACCGRTAERLFTTHGFRPRRVLSVDRERVTRSLIAGGIGVGLLHAGTAKDALARGEVALLHESQHPVRMLFAHAASRAQDPLLALADAIVREGV